MKIKFLLLSCLFAAISPVVFAQSVIVKPKKVVYTRKGAPKEKRHFDITYPTFSGAISPAAKKKLENTVSYWRVFETSLRESLDDTWLYTAYYKVNYNRSGLFDVSLTQEGSAAYPDEQTVNLIVNLKTGERVKFGDVFRSDALPKFAKMVDEKLQIENKRMMRRIDKGEFAEKDENTDASKVFRDDIENLKFVVDSFNEFSVNDKGVTILYDAGLPHAVKVLQPEGRYFFSWTQIKSFVRRDGLLARFIR